MSDTEGKMSNAEAKSEAETKMEMLSPRAGPPSESQNSPTAIKRESRSRSHSPHRSSSRSASRFSPRRKRSPSHSRSRSRSRSRSPVRSRSRSRSHGHSRSRSRSPPRERSRRRSYTRSRSRSPPRRSYGGGRGFGGPPPKPNNVEPNRVLGIFGLSMYTSQRAITDLMSKYGHVEKVDLILDRLTGRSKGFGFVYFENIETATKARNATNGLTIDERTIRVDYSMTKRAHTPTPGVYMGQRLSPRRYSGRRSRSPYGRDRSRSRSRSPPRRSYSRRSRSRSRSRDRRY